MMYQIPKETRESESCKSLMTYWSYIDTPTGKSTKDIWRPDLGRIGVEDLEISDVSCDFFLYLPPSPFSSRLMRLHL